MSVLTAWIKTPVQYFKPILDSGYVPLGDRARHLAYDPSSDFNPISALDDFLVSLTTFR